MLVQAVKALIYNLNVMVVYDTIIKTYTSKLSELQDYILNKVDKL